MKAIITIQNPDGSYDQCGMNNRCLISHLKTERGIRKWAMGYAQGKPHRIELFAHNMIFDEPTKVIENGSEWRLHNEG